MIKRLLFVALGAAFVFGAILWEFASWSECLKTHDWWFCLRLLG